VGFIAIVGSGPLGGAVAHALAVRDRVAEVRLIDPAGTIASGKALDIQQSAPIDSFCTRMTAAGSIDAAVGAQVIVIADTAAGAEHAGESGLGIVRQLVRAGHRGPLLFAGAQQQDVMAMAVAELHMSRSEVVGSAPFALESALRALAGLLIDASAVDISLRVVGVPPRHAVVAWEEATAGGQPLSSQMPAHEIAALAARIPSLWPPGPYALAAAAARVAEALARGSRRRFSCFVVADAGPVRTAVVSLPVEVGPPGVIRVLEPALTRQERTGMENAIERAARR
jgi:malate/lactate dehydrogenase